MSTPSVKKKDPRLNHEKILKLLQTSIQSILNSYDEPAAIMIGVTWQPELGDHLPFGMLLVKEDVTPELLGNCLKQNVKMCDYIVAGLRQKIAELHRITVKEEPSNDPPVRSTTKESYYGKESSGPIDPGPFAPGTK